MNCHSFIYKQIFALPHYSLETSNLPWLENVAEQFKALDSGAEGSGFEITLFQLPLCVPGLST